MNDEDHAQDARRRRSDRPHAAMPAPSWASARAPRTTPRRRRLRAIREAEVVVGYTTYIRLVRPLLEGKEIIKTGMTEEIGRARAAVERARAGAKVAIISSGDAGVYGMAGLVFQVLQDMGWRRGESPAAAAGARHDRAQLHRLAGGRAAGSRLLRHLAVRPADPLAGHRPADRGRRRRRLRDRPLQPGQRPAPAADRRGPGDHPPAPPGHHPGRRWSRAPTASCSRWTSPTSITCSSSRSAC